MVSGSAFKSLIHFEFTSVHSVRKPSSLILVHVAVQFSQHYLLERLSFPAFIFLPLCCRLIAHISADSFPVLCSVSLIYVSVFVPVPHCFDSCRFGLQFETRDGDTSSFLLLSQDCFGYSGSFVFPEILELFVIVL